MVRNLALISFVAVTGALAQGKNASTSVVTLTLPEIASQTVPIYASVITASSGTTAYHLGCPPQPGKEDCIVDSLTVVEGPDTISYEMTLFTEMMKVGCKVTSNTGICTGGVSGIGSAASVQPQVNTTTITDLASFWPTTAVTITAGLEKLAQQTGSPTTGTNKPAGSNAPDGSKTTHSSSSSKGGVPRNTQQAVLAGVAALAGGAILL